MNIGQLVASLGIDTAGVTMAERAMKEFENKANTSLLSVRGKIDSTAKAMENFGMTATKYLTVPLALAGGAAFKMGKDFEASMQHVVGLVGESQKQVDQWSKDILAMAPTIARGPKELADALYFVTSSGIKGAAALDVVTQSGKAASAGLGETMQIADLVTSAMNAYANSGLSATKSLDILTAAVREGKGEASQYATQMGEVIPVASKMGVSFDQVAGAMASMTLTGTNVSEAATYLRQILMSLMDPAKQSEQALRDMGTSGRELRQIIRDDGLLAALSKLNNLSSQYGEEVMAKIFPNVRALTGVLSLMGDRMGANAELQRKVTSSAGDMNKAFGVMTNTMEFRYNAALSAGKVALIELGLGAKSALLPVLESLTSILQKAAAWFGSLSDGTKRWIVILGATLALIGPVSMAVSFMMRGFALLLPLLNGAVQMFGALKIAMMANPILAVALALGTLVAYYATSFIPRTKEATQAQNELNNALEHTEQIAQKKAILDFLEKIGIFKKEVLGSGINALKLNILDTGNLDAVAKKISEIPVEYLNNMKGLIDSQMLELRRQIANLGTIGDDLTKNIAFKNKTEELKTYNAVLGIIEKELKKVDDIQKNTHRGSVIDLEELKRGHKMVLGQYDAFLQNLKKSGEDYQRVTSTIYDKGKTKYTMTGKINVPELDTGPIDNYRLHFLKLSDIKSPLEMVTAQLADLALANSVLGDSFDPMAIQLKTFGDQTSLLRTKIESLWSQGFRPGSGEIDNYIAKLQELTVEQDIAIQHSNNLQMISGVMGSSFASLAGQLGAMAAGMGDAWMNMVDIILQGANQIIAALLAEAIAATLMHKAVLMPIGGLIAGAIAVGALMALWGSYKASLSSAAQMAEGGVVPPGYPNDSYPARLTSGEMVVPPGKLALENLQPSQVNVHVTVEGIAHGEDLHYIIKEVERRHKNSF